MTRGPSTAGAAEPGDWPSYGADAAHSKYSTLDEIDAHNFADLKIAWRWTSIDEAIAAERAEQKQTRLFAPRFEATPIAIGGVLYLATSLGQAVAIDGATGRKLWSFDPKTYERGRPPNWGFVHRGVTHWGEGAEARIFLGTGDGRLIALDAATGRPIAQFGNKGEIDLTEGLPRRAAARQIAVTSPPAVCRGVVVVGTSISDGPVRKEMPPGQVRGYSAKSGRHLWTFQTIPRPGEPGHETWEEGAAEYTGNANVWAPISADEQLGYVYLPGSSPTNDWYGGHRKGRGLFGESLICLEAETGRLVWHYQLVHHGLWDYDLPAAPNLIDITVDGKSIRAVAQITKQGFCFVFDRVTGKPVWPIEERTVPGSDVPGESSWPTQPFPTRPPPYERQGVTENDLIDFTPELRMEALEIVKPFRMGPLYSPPSLQGTLQLPGSSGGANWGGAAFDPDTGMFYVPSITSPIVVMLLRPDPARSNFNYVRSGQRRIDGPRGLPLLKPPYGRITAFDLHRGAIAWRAVNGDGPRNHEALAGLDLAPMGQIGRAGPLLTATLLLLAEGTTATNSAGTAGGGTLLRAFDKATGKIVARIDLGAEATGTPMTYRAGGRQFIAVATGGRDRPAELIALALAVSPPNASLEK